MSASILGPNGQRIVELGGERAWRQRVTGDIVSSYQWMHIDEIDDSAPVACLCLFPALRHVETAAYVIPQSNAYLYAARDGGVTPQLVGLAFKAAVHMGFHPDKTTVHRIMDIVVDGIPDLIAMPSEQPGALDIKRAILGIEAQATINGRVIQSEVL
jgi:hypothetical protein